jgi:glycerophosphoryl diester phosphodiesterase
MRKIISMIMALTLMASAVAFAAKPKVTVPKSETAPNGVNVTSFEQLQAYFRYDPKRDVIISAHRGGMMDGYPENCVESCEKTLSMMPTFFEIDFSFTKDSVMVLMHDLSIDRCTNGTGNISDHTYGELEKLSLVDRNKKITPYKIPTIKQMLEWGKGKCVFNFDNKYLNSAGVTEAQKKTALDYYIKQLSAGGDWSMYHNIMLSTRSLKETEYYWNHGIHNVMFCVEMKTMDDFKAYDQSPIPWDHIMGYIRLAVNPEQQALYNSLHAKGVMIMTSITGSSDKVKNPYDRHVAYYREVLAEPDIIETDYPSEFIGIPWDRATIHKMQNAAIKGMRKGK